MNLIEPRLGDGYYAAFSTREGGVSEGDFESLNLGILTEDDPERVVENRRLLCAAAEVEPETATMPWQVHGARVFEADGRGIVTPGTEFEQGDGLWTETPGRALGVLSADCFPVVLARRAGRPRIAVLHVGWRGLAAGLVETGMAALAGPAVAAVGPGIGPCCYEVGDEVAEPFRARFGESVLRGRNLDLPEAIERALRAAGVEEVERTGHCTSCEPELFFSHRRDRGRTGRQGVIAAIR
ncbi:MAG TPA: polyphenol oxidase family protein [Gaiellaceae bacterium]|nr:polyphenol oxidase family protein [Gaiellaceae bacterium]